MCSSLGALVNKENRRGSIWGKCNSRKKFAHHFAVRLAFQGLFAGCNHSSFFVSFVSFFKVYLPGCAVEATLMRQCQLSSADRARHACRQDQLKLTPLMRACMRGNAASVRILLSVENPSATLGGMMCALAPWAAIPKGLFCL